MLLKALTESREGLGLSRGHMALGQWIKMGEHDNYGIALGAWGGMRRTALGYRYHWEVSEVFNLFPEVGQNPQAPCFGVL